MPALHGCRAACAVRGVPSVIAATKLTNAQVKAKELIIVLVNFVFIVLVSFCLSFFIVLAFLASHRGRSHLAVHSFLRKILPGVAKTKILSGEPPKPTRVRASITAKAQRSARASSCRGSAFPLSTGSSATLGDGLAEACQRSPPSYDDGAADSTTGLAGIKVRALVRGEAASSTSVPARSADNGPGIHMAKIAVGA